MFSLAETIGYWSKDLTADLLVTLLWSGQRLSLLARTGQLSEELFAYMMFTRTG